MTLPSLSFAAQITDFPSLSDSEFLQALAWDRSASPALRTAAAEGKVLAFTKAWQSQRRAKASSSTPAECYGERALWSEAAFPEEAGLARVVRQTIEAANKNVRAGSRRPAIKPSVDWSQRIGLLINELTDAITSEETRPFALLVSLEILVHAGHKLSVDDSFKLWRSTLTELLMWPTVAYDDPTVPADVTLVELGEIPFVGGLLFSEIASASNLVKAGRKFLTKDMVDRADSDGSPHAEILRRLPLWLAPLVRSSMMMERFQTTPWNDDLQLLFSNIVDRAILLCRPDGRAALTNGLSLDSIPVLTAAAEQLDLGLVESTTEYLRVVQRAIAGKPPRRGKSAAGTMPSNQSDWARFALLRSGWGADADSVAIAHHQSLPQLDVTAMGRPLIHGDWKLNIKLGETPVELAEEWSCVCWQSDPDADYIELQMAGPGKMRVERIVMLSREERFLIVADAISGVPNAELENGKRGTAKQLIQYESRLSLCEGLIGSAEGTTREARVNGKRIKARVFPVGIPQDRVNSTPHSLNVEGNELVLRQVAEGEGLFAPLVFVWHPDRTRVDATWRQLTVSEEGKTVGNDVAVGYRLKLGAYQLFISRALKRTGNSRACLGHHTFNETVIAKFDSNGDVEPILMVE